MTYYYLTDLEEGAAPFDDSGGPKMILWYGDRRTGLPEDPSDIPRPIGIGARHRQKLHRRTMIENRISPTSHITLADTEIRYK